MMVLILPPTLPPRLPSASGLHASPPGILKSVSGFSNDFFFLWGWEINPWEGQALHSSDPFLKTTVYKKVGLWFETFPAPHSKLKILLN